MLSIEVHRLLAAVEAGESLTPTALGPLLDRHWVERVEAKGDPQQLVELRTELRNVQAIRADAAGHPERRSMFDDASRRERELRMAILDLSEASARGDRPLALTWRGRELLSELGPRLTRLDGVDVDAFETQLGELVADLSALATRASQIAQQFRFGSAGFGTATELTLKAVAIGLASHPAGAEAASAAWNATRSRLPTSELAVDSQAVLSQALVGHHPHGFDKVEADAAWRLVSPGLPVDEAASVLAVVGVGPAIQPLMAQARRLRASLPELDAVGAALLAAGGAEGNPALVDEAARVAQAVVGALPATTRGRVIALLALAPGDADVALARFHGIRRWLAGFVGDDAALSAATLALLWAGPDEILDDLRIAAEVVDRVGLGSGGVGSLALGARLLLTAGSVAPRGLLPPVTTTRGSLSSAQLLQVTGTFHHDSLHRAALVVWHAERVRQLHAHHHGG